MKALFTLLAGALITVPAHAMTFNCSGKNSTQAAIQLQCDDASCVINGTAQETDMLGHHGASFTNCGGTRRPETNAPMYKALAYYDVTDKACWANYVRVAKNFAADGSIDASIVQTGGGDTHDYSGYQYFYLNCQAQN